MCSLGGTVSAETRQLTFTLPSDTSVTAMAATCGRRVTVNPGFARGGRRTGGYRSGPPCGLRSSILGAAPTVYSGFPSNDRPPLKCQIFRRSGHSVIDCYDRLNLSYEGRVPSARLTALAAHPSHCPMAASSPTSSLLNSGASAHITNNAIVFFVFYPKIFHVQDIHWVRILLSGLSKTGLHPINLMDHLLLLVFVSCLAFAIWLSVFIYFIGDF